MHPLSFLLALFASSTAALPATPAAPTSPLSTLTNTPDRPGSSQHLQPEPFLPTAIPVSTDVPEADPTPSPIYSTLTTPKTPSNSSSPATNSTAPCFSRRPPLRLGPARLHRKPSQDSLLSTTGTRQTTPTSFAAPAVAVAVAAAAVETPTDSGPRDYASLIPPAPGVTPRPEPNLAELGFYQTTYYSCVTRKASVHCGWHRPILVAPANNAAGSSSASRRACMWLLVAALVGALVAR
ncbi:hypothetical protein CDEST_13231 [Colletotrichum destructivum]|uniref:Uncharacterized protein n=1 Tax=Colletotrichum destructivum TaxID=34406 RepID=A0AAX4IYL9_9PEZI|nr:hypothetical protein CDEST_13231 [Colletotrichum destructivum]